MGLICPSLLSLQHHDEQEKLQMAMARLQQNLSSRSTSNMDLFANVSFIISRTRHPILAPQWSFICLSLFDDIIHSRGCLSSAVEERLQTFRQSISSCVSLCRLQQFSQSSKWVNSGRLISGFSLQLFFLYVSLSGKWCLSSMNIFDSSYLCSFHIHL